MAGSTWRAIYGKMWWRDWPPKHLLCPVVFATRVRFCFPLHTPQIILNYTEWNVKTRHLRARITSQQAKYWRCVATELFKPQESPGYLIIPLSKTGSLQVLPMPLAGGDRRCFWWLFRVRGAVGAAGAGREDPTEPSLCRQVGLEAHPQLSCLCRQRRWRSVQCESLAYPHFNML